MPKTTVYAFGKNYFLSSGDMKTFPPITREDFEGITTISANNSFFIALKDDGTVCSAGSNTQGQLGCGHTKPFSGLFSVPLSNIIMIATGQEHAMAVSVDQQVYTWGSVLSLGRNSGAGKFAAPGRVTLTSFNSKVDQIKQIACGYDTCFVLLASGKIYEWGQNKRFLLNQKTSQCPMIVDASKFNNEKVEEIVVQNSSYSGFARTAAGNYYAWGGNSSGELGTGDKVDGTSPLLHPFLKASTIRKVIIGYGPSHCLTTDNKLFSCGYNSDGRLCVKGNTSSFVDISSEHNIPAIKDIACGYGHILYLTFDNKVYAHGYNEYMEAGATGTSIAKAPNHIKFFDDKKVFKIEANAFASFVYVLNYSDWPYPLYMEAYRDIAFLFK